MFGMMKKFRELMKNDRRGVTALEYGLIAAVIGGVVITAATSFGTGLSSSFSTIGSKLTTQAAAM